MPIDRPRTSSYSTIKMFDECPLRDWLTNGLKRKSPKAIDTTAQLRGKELHDIAARLARAERVDANAVQRTYGDAMFPHLKASIARYLVPKPDRIGVEAWGVWVSPSDVKFYARIDLWTLRGGDLTIVDWKSGSLQYADEMQLRWNALALVARETQLPVADAYYLAGRKLASIRYVFASLEPPDGDFHDAGMRAWGPEPAPEAIDHARATLAPRIAARQDARVRAPRDGWWCKRCEWTGTGDCPLH